MQELDACGDDPGLCAVHVEHGRSHENANLGIRTESMPRGHGDCFWLLIGLRRQTDAARNRKLY